MAAATEYVTVKFTVPGEANNVEAKFPVSDLDTVIETIQGIKNGFVRELTPRNKWGSRGMPTDLKREKLLAELAKLEESA